MSGTRTLTHTRLRRNLPDDGPYASRYALLLNTSGRVLNDLIVYSHELNDVFVEVDVKLLKPFIDTLLRCDCYIKKLVHRAQVSHAPQVNDYSLQ
jgi:folate-binding Fe-S cluster repair protein YgfZ